jgi:hypothetical protein
MGTGTVGAELVGCSIGCSKSQVHKARKRRNNRRRIGEERHAEHIIFSGSAGLPPVRRLKISVREVADSDISFWAPVECRALRKICRIDV